MFNRLIVLSLSILTLLIFSDYSQTCPDCHKRFYSATSLLVHFFTHVDKGNADDVDNNENNSVCSDKSEDTNNNESSKPLNLTKSETFNPWKYCLASYEENIDSPNKPTKKIKPNKKKDEKHKNFECRLCGKKFGWSTDLKRHLLIHTGRCYLNQDNNTF